MIFLVHTGCFPTNKWPRTHYGNQRSRCFRKTEIGWRA